MNNFSEAMFAIVFVTMAITGIVFAFAVGTLLAPVAVVILAVLFVYKFRQEEDKSKKRCKRRK